MSKALLLVDVANIYAGVRNKWPDHNLEYEKVLKAYSDIGNRILSKVAYILPGKQRFNRFFSVLKKIGFQFDEFDPASMALAVAESVPHFDTVIIGTNNAYIMPTIMYARQKGMVTHVFGVDVHPHIERFAEVFEIDSDFIRPRSQTTEQMELPADSPCTTGVSID